MKKKKSINEEKSINEDRMNHFNLENKQFVLPICSSYFISSINYSIQYYENCVFMIETSLTISSNPEMEIMYLWKEGMKKINNKIIQTDFAFNIHDAINKSLNRKSYDCIILNQITPWSHRDLLELQNLINLLRLKSMLLIICCPKPLQIEGINTKLIPFEKYEKNSINEKEEIINFVWKQLDEIPRSNNFFTIGHVSLERKCPKKLIYNYQKQKQKQIKKLIK